TEADVPSRFGVAARVEPLSGVTLFVGADRTEWSGMNGLGSASAAAQDTWEYSAGAQFSGQSLRNTPWTYSLGARQRDLPFAAAGTAVKETIYAGGLGIPIAGPRGMLELALQRAVRDANSAATERAWLLSVGFVVRP
ncbi:MAG: hypothetical protein IT360_19430, partial [Gemmatimonadaceae bacterium]|nr:hypothetical protein [Gemmatimonadaceae bacterium]